MTLCLSSCASETDIMRCTMCSQIIKKTCVTDCPFKKYFGDQNKETLRKIRDHCTLELMREFLTDDYPTDEIKERVIEGWYGCVNKKVPRQCHARHAKPCLKYIWLRKFCQR